MYTKKHYAFAILSLLFASTLLSSCFNDADEYMWKDAKEDPFLFVEGFQDQVTHELNLQGGTTAADWMSLLDDSRHACKVTIPGTHDALTGMGFYDKDMKYIYNITAISQVSTLNQQLDNGIRFFDIRPVVAVDTLNHKRVLRCAHGISEISVDFEEALTMCQSFLAKHSSEFIIIKMQADNGTENQSKWVPMMVDLLEGFEAKHPGIFAEWRPDITVGELRGKILFVNRLKFNGMHGAYCEYPDEDADVFEKVDYEEEMSNVIESADGSTCAPMYVQDYYKTTKPNRMQTKIDAVLNMLNNAREVDEDEDVWIVNHCSAYTQVSPRGYAENAEMIHPIVIEDMLKPENKHKSVGVVAIDFSCYDNVSVVINAGSPYISDYLYGKKPMSRSLVNLLIMSNFDAEY